MLPAGSRTPPLGDFVKRASAVGADASDGVQSANRFARGGRALGHKITVILPLTSAQTTSQHRPAPVSPKSAVHGCTAPNAG
jgi:hypothetical protein